MANLGLINTLLKIIFFPLIVVLHYRRSIISIVLILVILYLPSHMNLSERATQVTIAVGTLLISSDYKVIKPVSEPVYTWIHSSRDTNSDLDPIKIALERARINYYTKKFMENGEPEMEVIQYERGILDVNSGNYTSNLQEEMELDLYFRKRTDYGGESFYVDKKLGTVRIDAVSASKGICQASVIQWNSDYLLQQIQFRLGLEHEMKPFVKVDPKREVERSDLSELETTHTALRRIYNNREKLIE